MTGGEHDDGGGRGHADGTGQLGDEAAAAGAGVEPQLDTDERCGRDDRPPERVG